MIEALRLIASVWGAVENTCMYTIMHVQLSKWHRGKASTLSVGVPSHYFRGLQSKIRVCVCMCVCVCTVGVDSARASEGEVCARIHSHLG